MINIADTKVARRIGEYFIKHISKLRDVSLLFFIIYLKKVFIFITFIS